MKFALCEFVLIAFAVFMAILNRRNRTWLLFWLGLSLLPMMFALVIVITELTRG